MFDLVLAAADPDTAVPLSDLAMWSAVTGVVLPPIVSVVNSANWPSAARAIVTLVICIATGAVTTALEGTLTAGRWTTSALVVATAAIGSYRLWWRPSGIAPAIEQATTVSRRPAPRSPRY